MSVRSSTRRIIMQTESKAEEINMLVVTVNHWNRERRAPRFTVTYKSRGKEAESRKRFLSNF